MYNSAYPCAASSNRARNRRADVPAPTQTEDVGRLDEHEYCEQVWPASPRPIGLAQSEGRGTASATAVVAHQVRLDGPRRLLGSRRANHCRPTPIGRRAVRRHPCPARRSGRPTPRRRRGHPPPSCSAWHAPFREPSTHPGARRSPRRSHGSPSNSRRRFGRSSLVWRRSSRRPGPRRLPRRPPARETVESFEPLHRRPPGGAGVPLSAGSPGPAHGLLLRGERWEQAGRQ
jgi:hypothetical protein